MFGFFLCLILLVTETPVAQTKLSNCVLENANEQYTQYFFTFCAKNVLTRSFIIPAPHTYFSTVQTDPLPHFELFKGKKKHESVKTAQFKFCCFGGSRQELVPRRAATRQSSMTVVQSTQNDFTNLNIKLYNICI